MKVTINMLNAFLHHIVGSTICNKGWLKFRIANTQLKPSLLRFGYGLKKGLRYGWGRVKIALVLGKRGMLAILKFGPKAK